METKNQNRKKGTEVNKKTDNKIDRKMLFAGVMAAVLGIIVAVLWVCRSLGGEEGLAICTIIATASSTLIGKLTKYKVFFERVRIIIVIFFLFYGSGLFVGKIVVKNGTENIQNSEELERIEEDIEENIDENEEEYVVKTFIYKEDVLFEDLVYYVDGHEIKKDETEDVLKNFIKENLFCGELPERYEDDKEKLNSGVYAKETNTASDYFESYKYVKAKDIKEEHKLLLVNEARKNRKEADNEYVTIENSRNLVWACEATRQELWLCIDGTIDEEQINKWKDEAKECNKEIMEATWNILQIEFYFGMEISEDMVAKLVEAYKWERDHTPEKNVDYDELINAFNDVFYE